MLCKADARVYVSTVATINRESCLNVVVRRASRLLNAVHANNFPCSNSNQIYFEQLVIISNLGKIATCDATEDTLQPLFG